MNCPNQAEIDPICEDLFVPSFYDECKKVLPVADSIAICKLEYCLKTEASVVNRIVENYLDACIQALPDQSSRMCEYGSANWYSQVFLTPGAVTILNKAKL